VPVFASRVRGPTIGQKIKEQRLRQGLSKRALGRKLGVSAASIARWEKGMIEPQDYNKARVEAWLTSM